ncbi:hypothetical protein D3C86_1829640 [compost metagenome]
MVARRIIQKDLVKAGMDAVDPDHAGHELFNESSERLPLLRDALHDGETVLEVTMAYRFHDRNLVREILIERADADAGRFGDPVRGKTRPAVIA